MSFTGISKCTAIDILLLIIYCHESSKRQILSHPNLHDDVRKWAKAVDQQFIESPPGMTISKGCSNFLKAFCDPEGINNTSCIRRSWMTLIEIIFSLVLVTVVIGCLGSNMVLASTIRVTQHQAELIEWCTKEMVRVTDAGMVQALNVCAGYYLKAE